MSKTSSVVIAMICSTFFLGAAKSQDFDSPLISYKYQRLSEMILSNYKKNSSDNDKRIINNIKVTVDDTDQNVYGVRAQVIDGRREIIIPMGFLAAIYDVNVAFADKMTFGAEGYIVTDDLSDYIEYVSHKLKASDIAVRTGGDIPGILNFCAFRKLPVKECAKRGADSNLLRVVSKIQYSALSFITGHEIGHHVLGHLGNGKSLFLSERDTASREMETAADIYSTKAMVRSDLLVSGAMATMFLFSFLKGESALNVVSGDHPHPICRWIKMLEAQQDELPNNQNLVQFLNDNGVTLEDNRAGLDALRTTAPQCLL